VRLLFVCTGNICRSPLAEAMARHMLHARGRSDIEVASAGTAAPDGSPASEGAYLVALENGLDLSAHTARQLTTTMVETADLIFGMSPHHVQRAEQMGGMGKAHLLGTWAGRDADHDEVPDPYGGDLEEYRVTCDQLDGYLHDAIARILGENGAREGPDNA
jgi:protein-tyrosine phosphatase